MGGEERGGGLGNRMSCQHCPHHVHNSRGSEQGPFPRFCSVQRGLFLSVWSPLHPLKL